MNVHATPSAGAFPAPDERTARRENSIITFHIYYSMRTGLFSLVILVLALCAAGLAQKMFRLVLDDKKDFMLHELGAVIHQGHDTLAVRTLLPGFSPADENKGAELKEGDIVVFANGVRLKSTQTLRAMYDSLANGGDLKLGVKRDGENLMVDIHKVPQKNAPGEQVNKVMIDPDKSAMLAGIAVLELDGGNLVVEDLMRWKAEGDTASHDAPGLEMGDVVKTINGKTYSSVKRVTAEYKEIKTGAPIEFKIERGGKELTITLPKPKAEKMQFIRKD